MRLRLTIFIGYIKSKKFELLATVNGYVIPDHQLYNSVTSASVILLFQNHTSSIAHSKFVHHHIKDHKVIASLNPVQEPSHTEEAVLAVQSSIFKFRVVQSYLQHIWYVTPLLNVCAL